MLLFQNARQKQRKIYENQPNNTYNENEERRSNINYTCRKCNLAFQRYYELIRHQKNHCFKEENNKKSAKAQIAAAQIAQNLSSEDSNSSMDVNSSVGSVSGGASSAPGASTSMLSATNLVVAAAAAVAAAAQEHTLGGTLMNVGCGGNGGGISQNVCLGSPNNDSTSNATSPNLNLYKTTCLSPQSSAQQPFLHQLPPQPQTRSSTPSTNKFECDKCNLTFPRLDLYKEHQLIHLMSPNIILNQQLLNQSFNENSPFNILQNMTAGSGLLESNATVDLTKNRKLSESSDNDLADFKSLNKKYKNDQLDFLYNYFLQNEQSDELKKQEKANMDFDNLYQYYQMNELKKKGANFNFDYLYQYYLQNEKNQKLMASPTLRNAKSPTIDTFGGEKPSFDFLFQYHQLNESKKLFQADPITSQDAKTDLMKQMLSLLQKQQHQQQQQQQRPASVMPKSRSKAAVGDSIVSGSLPLSTASMESFTDQNSDLFNASGSGISCSRSPESQSTPNASSTSEKQSNKRLRTTILPEQLNFLYECYQNESNPSRKMLEEISKKVNLKKRVVQVNSLQRLLIP